MGKVGINRPPGGYVGGVKVGCRPPGGNVRYSALNVEHASESAIADVAARRSATYPLPRKSSQTWTHPSPALKKVTFPYLRETNRLVTTPLYKWDFREWFPKKLQKFR